MNTKHPHIKFTFEHEHNNRISSMDVKMYLENNKLTASVYIESVVYQCRSNRGRQGLQVPPIIFGIFFLYTNKWFNPHMHKIGPLGSKHFIFGNHFYWKNARKLRFYVFLHFNARKHLISSFYLKRTKFTRNCEFVPI